MASFLRFVLGVLLLPACWSVSRALFDVLCHDAGAGDFLRAGTIALLAGVVLFAALWAFLPHPVKTYVFGHELTHALWGLLFGARPKNLRVSAKGGSVSLSKTNFIITLAPYFFPFYTFVVCLAAFVVSRFVSPLPFFLAWVFLVGFTWAFHVLFTLETLTQRQPDVKLYGRLFSWTVIYCVNVLVVLAGVVAMTLMTFAQLRAILAVRLSGGYGAVWSAAVSLLHG